MNSQMTNLEEMYARLAMEEDDTGGVIVAEGDIQQPRNTYVLVGRFLTERNINFNAMQNVLASLWRPKEGMDVHDIGGSRFSFVFYHPLDLQKVLEGGPWTFEQSLLVSHKLGEHEDPHLVKLNKIDIWVQIYDLPQGFISENILMSIGKFIGSFVKTDPANLTGGWKLYQRIRVTMDLDKPLKRRMKIKREGGDWSWVNFKYERLSTFCFVCGMLGHSDRDCGIVYANTEKEIERAYGTWLRAPTRNTNTQNMGARWLRSSMNGSQTGGTGGGRAHQSTTVHGGDRVHAKFMDVDGKLGEFFGDNGGIKIVQRDQGGNSKNNSLPNQKEIITEAVFQDSEVVIIDPKRRRVADEDTTKGDGVDNFEGPSNLGGPKNLQEAGPVPQARLDK
ncbi:hypothetical protein DCAR_0831359 [Daucus carota subsp. sativus]|uniref:CCHC-type domain-containing protein n=1 Tax=Daucus carota subsp. sativus TaxID=79200 RepID=A0AAF0XPL0_DAUCS|nr:hypothetical protein DCAR_0831359 [Daucus carota subsp. sativus]